MATKDEILSWADGVNAYKNSDWDGALDSFQRTGDFSRVHFNMGIIYTRLDDYESASMCYTNAIGADPYLAVAFFQRAYCAYMTEDYQRADGDYAMALELLRENDFIDYSQLGLKYRLYRCEAHYNRAMCAHSIGDDAICTQDVLAAQRVARTTEQKAVIDRAARVGVETVTLFTVPVDAVFEVPESKLKNINERSYLKDAKVVIDSSPGAGGDGQANWAGFDGALILNKDIINAQSDGMNRTGTVVRNARNGVETMGRRRAETDPNRGFPSGGSGRFDFNNAPTLPRQDSLRSRRSDPDDYMKTEPQQSYQRRQYNTAEPEARPIRRSFDGSYPEQQEMADQRQRPRFNNTQYPTRNGSNYSQNSVTMGRNVGNESYSARSDPQPRKTSMPETSYNNNNNNNNNQNIDYYPPRKLSTPTSPADYMAVNRSRTMNSTPSPPLSTPSLGPGKMKIKLHSIPSNGGNQRTVMLLVDANQFPAITYKTLITRCRDKFGYRNPTVSYKDPEDYNQHGISVVDDDDLSVAMEILDGRVEFWVSDN